MTPIIHLAISDQISGWYAETGPILFYIVVWGLVFAGTGLFVGAFIPANHVFRRLQTDCRTIYPFAPPRSRIWPRLVFAG